MKLAVGQWGNWDARHLRDEFFTRSALDPDTVRGLEQLMAGPLNFQYLQAPLAPGDLDALVQVPPK